MKDLGRLKSVNSVLFQATSFKMDTTEMKRRMRRVYGSNLRSIGVYLDVEQKKNTGFKKYLPPKMHEVPPKITSSFARTTFSSFKGNWTPRVH